MQAQNTPKHIYCFQYGIQALSFMNRCTQHLVSGKVRACMLMLSVSFLTANTISVMCNLTFARISKAFILALELGFSAHIRDHRSAMNSNATKLINLSCSSAFQTHTNRP